MTPKQRRFVSEYFIDLNATQAAIRAGYAKRSAFVTASRLLRNPKVATAISLAQAKHEKRAEMHADEWRTQLAAIARSDLRLFVDSDTGALKPVSELSDEAAACLSSIEIERRRTRIKDEGETVEESLVKVRFWDKVRALELYGKHLGLLKDQVELSGRVGLVSERIIAARRRVGNPA